MKFLNEDEAYLDFLNESKSVGLNNWDEVIILYNNYLYLYFYYIINK
jgi:hypothetical protein